MAPDFLVHERMDMLEIMADRAYELEQAMREEFSLEQSQLPNRCELLRQV